LNPVLEGCGHDKIIETLFLKRGGVFDFISRETKIMNDEVKASAQSMDERSAIQSRVAELKCDLSETLTEKDALRDSEFQFQRMVENISDVIFEVDHQGIVLYISPIGRDIWGYEQEDVIGKNFIEHVHFDDREILIKRFVELGAGVEKPMVYRLKNKAGEFKWVRTKTKPRIENGRFIGAIGTLIDFNDQKQMENVLRETEERLRLTLDATNDGVWDWNIPTGKAVFSPRYFTMLGFEPYEFPENYDSWRSLVHPDDIERTEREINEHINGNIGYAIEMRMRTKSGGWRWILTRGMVVERDAENHPVRMVGTHSDITSRKHAEEALQDSEANYRRLFDSAPAGIYQVDFRTGKFLKANDIVCGILGCTQEEVSLYSPWDILTDESKQLFLERLGKMNSGEEIPDSPVYEVIVKDGRRLWLQLSSKNIYDSEGIVGADVVAHDITSQKHAEEQLQHTLGRLRKAVSTTIQVMVSAVETRDPYTAGHQIRSADLARAIATEMGLPQERIDGIHMAGSIHDIGKMSVPAEILVKPTTLSELEFSLIKEHAKKGFEMLKDVESPWPLAEIVYQHHERMNGSGYPRHLKGEEIIIEARVLAVADVVEAMASHRPYRPAIGLDAALVEIEHNKGTLYDSTAVNACLRLFREKGFKLEGA